METIAEQHKRYNFKSVSYLTGITKTRKGGEPRPISTVTGRLPHKSCSHKVVRHTVCTWRKMTQVQTDLGVIEDCSNSGRHRTALDLDCRLHSSGVHGPGYGWRTALPKMIVLTASFWYLYSRMYVRHFHMSLVICSVCSYVCVITRKVSPKREAFKNNFK